MRNVIPAISPARAAAIIIGEFDDLDWNDRSQILDVVRRSPHVAAWALTRLEARQIAELRLREPAGFVALVQSIAANPWTVRHAMPSFASLTAAERAYLTGAAAHHPEAARQMTDQLMAPAHAAYQRMLIDTDEERAALLKVISAAQHANAAAFFLMRFFDAWTDNQRLELASLAAKDPLAATRIINDLRHAIIIRGDESKRSSHILRILTSGAALHPDSAALAVSALDVLDDHDRVRIIRAAASEVHAAHTALTRMGDAQLQAICHAPGGVQALVDLLSRASAVPMRQMPYAVRSAWKCLPPSYQSMIGNALLG